MSSKRNLTYKKIFVNVPDYKTDKENYMSYLVNKALKDLMHLHDHKDAAEAVFKSYTPEIVCEISLELLKKRNFKRAKAIFSRLLKACLPIEKHQEEAYKNTALAFAELYKKTGNNEKTAHYLNIAINKGGAIDKAHELSMLYLDLQKYEDAEYYLELSGEFLGSEAYYFDLGRIYEAKEDYEKAEEFYRSALCGEEYPEANYHLGGVCKLQGKYNEAKKQFDYLIKYHNHEDAAFQLAVMYDELEKYIEAAEQYGQYIRLTFQQAFKKNANGENHAKLSYADYIRKASKRITEIIDILKERAKKSQPNPPLGSPPEV